MQALSNIKFNSNVREISKAVMLYAHETYNLPTCFYSWSEMVKEAWRVVKSKIKELNYIANGVDVPVKELNNMLINNETPVEFGYTKKNGEFRIFCATKNFNIIPSEHKPTGDAPASTNMRFFDFNANGWRGLVGGATHVVMLK